MTNTVTLTDAERNLSPAEAVAKLSKEKLVAYMDGMVKVEECKPNQPSLRAEVIDPYNGHQMMELHFGGRPKKLSVAWVLKILSAKPLIHDAIVKAMREGNPELKADIDKVAAIDWPKPRPAAKAG